MYVCLCQGITDRQIREAICSGCSSMCELRSRLKVCSDCGKCAGAVEALLAECGGGPGAAHGRPAEGAGPCSVRP